jgi:DNA (cytosine-5)-methyltransferase 1
VNVVDLFCGCGGFALGAHQAGIETSLAIDVDAILSSAYLSNFPNAKLLVADLSAMPASKISKRFTDIDGVFGGPPCQAFSEIGHRKLDDPRRDLLLDFFRLVAKLKPAFFVMENVPGLGYAEARPLLDRALDLVSGKYDIFGPIILDAADFGAATRRERMFVIGTDTDKLHPFSMEDIAAQRRPATTVRAAIGDLQYARYVGQDGSFDVWKTGRGRPSEYARGLRAKEGQFTGHLATQHSLQVRKRFSKVKPGDVDKVGWHPRLDWNGQCPTLRAGTGSERGSYQSVRPIHPEEDRVITVREAARLQGFPDSFRFHPTIWHSFRMIGNSVSPIISRAIFKAIAEKFEPKRRFLAAAE